MTPDRDDVRNIIAIGGSQLDWAYIERWTGTHGTTDLLQVLRLEEEPGR